MNIKVKRAIFIILIIINCTIIFKFSSQNSEKSSEASGGIVNKIVTIISKNEQDENLEHIVTVIIRKCAHFSIFTLLGIWIMCEANTFNINERKKFGISIALGSLYAASDEFHQMFVSGRSAQITDVFIDTLGIIFGCIIVKILYKFIDKKLKK